MINLNKYPGVCRIGIGETLSKIIRKAVCLVTSIDAALMCGSDQMSAGLKTGIGGAIHAMNGLFSTNQDQSSAWGVLLFDSANALNSLNRTAML